MSRSARLSQRIENAIKDDAAARELLALLDDVDGIGDQLVIATLEVVDAVGGATDVALTLTLTRALDGGPVTTPRQVLIVGDDTQYGPEGYGTLNTTGSFNTATAGAFIDSDQGWALVQTDDTGVFACAITNAVDETVSYRAIRARAVSDLAEAAGVVGGNVVNATWSA